MVRDQISSTRKEIFQVAKQRQTGRSRRQKLPLPTVAIVGYTNAGKSTLLNCLTGADTLSADKLFATLDPTSRRLKLPNGRIIVLTDTVGFIRKLPHRLVDSFKATLEEALVADLILHLVDFSNPQYEAQMSTTDEVLRELGASEKDVITVYNKIDRVHNDLEKLKAVNLASPAVFISAQTGEGLNLLLSTLENFFSVSKEPEKFKLPFDRYDLAVRLKSQGGLISEETTEQGYVVKGCPRGDLINALSEYMIR